MPLSGVLVCECGSGQVRIPARCPVCDTSLCRTGPAVWLRWPMGLQTDRMMGRLRAVLPCGSDWSSNVPSAWPEQRLLRTVCIPADPAVCDTAQHAERQLSRLGSRISGCRVWEPWVAGTIHRESALLPAGRRLNRRGSKTSPCPWQCVRVWPEIPCCSFGR